MSIPFKTKMSIFCPDCEEHFDEVTATIYDHGRIEEYNCPKCNKLWTGANDQEIANSLIRGMLGR